MANNPYVNKVEFGNQVLLDLTGDTVTPGDVLQGVTFHTRDGASGVGTLIVHDVLDTLTSSSTDDALSANQGRVLKGLFDNMPRPAFGSCIDQENNQVKAVTVQDPNWTLQPGCIIGVKFNSTNAYSADAEHPIQLNVNNTGGVTIYAGHEIPTGTSSTRFGRDGYIIFYLYDGTYWVWMSYSGYVSYSPETLGSGYGTSSSGASSTTKRVSLSNYDLVKGGIIAVKFQNAVQAGASLNVNSRGAKPIYHKGAAITDGKIDAGDTATFIYDGTNYNLLCVDNF